MRESWASGVKGLPCSFVFSFAQPNKHGSLLSTLNKQGSLTRLQLTEVASGRHTPLLTGAMLLTAQGVIMSVQSMVF